jgi:hypothetical protein
MKKVLTVAAVAEVATGIALLIVPSLVGVAGQIGLIRYGPKVLNVITEGTTKLSLFRWATTNRIKSNETK